MTSSAGSPGSNPPADPAAGGGQGGGEEGRIQSLDARFAAQDEKITGLGSKLDEILGKLGGGGGPKAGTTGTPGSGPAGSPAQPSTESIADQVRRGVEEIE